MAAASVDVAVTLFNPLGRPSAGVQLHKPEPLAVVVHNVTPFSLTVTSVSASALPPITGRLVLMVLPLMGVVMIGGTGATVSTVTTTGGEVNGPTCATSGVLPFGSGDVIGHDQLPCAFVVVVQMTVPVGDVVTVTGVFGVPVPANVGVVVLTGVPGCGDVIAGAILLMLNGCVVGWLTLPAGSVAVAFTAVDPFGSGVVVQLHCPLGEATVVHNTLPSGSVTLTVLLGSAPPLIVGVLEPTVEPDAGPVMVGFAGGTVSTTIGRGVPAGLTLPAGSIAVVPIECGPLISGVVGAQPHVPIGATVVVHNNVPVG